MTAHDEGIVQVTVLPKNASPNEGGYRHHVKTALRTFTTGRPVAAISALTVMMLVIVAVFAPVLPVQNPYDLASLSIADSVLPPGSKGVAGDYYVFGTDEQGRDLLSAIVYGLRISLMVGVSSTVLALVIGVIVGLVSGYLGKMVDVIAMRIVDMQLSVPSILVALIILAVLGQGVDKIIAALVIVQWAYYARTIRSVTLAEKRREYIVAAQCLRLPVWRIVLRHLLPNCVGPVLVIGALQLAHAISLEATLSFLGLGLPVTQPSLGMLIANGYSYALNGKYWISVIPGLCLVLLVFSMNIVADRMRELLDPRRLK